VIQHEVLTTEKVPFRYRVAGLGSRFLAWLADIGIILFAYLIGGVFFSLFEAGRAGLGIGLFILWMFALNWGYFLLFEWLWSGQTPGKRAVGIRVVRFDGTAISFVQSAVRNLLRIADALPLPLPIGAGLLGFAVACGNRENRRLGDLAADTLVVHLDRKARALQTFRGDLPDTPPDPAWRQRLARLDREQKRALLELCLRRDQLQLAERARLFRAAGHFARRRLDLAPGPHESDENFILRLAALLEE
jgi:uncharacterized RDD family membrane protein YckC